HHFLGSEDLNWLSSFNAFELNENQKRGLVLVKEMGAMDNSAYRQTNNLDTLKASTELRDLSKKGLLAPKGKGRATYYVPGKNFSAPPQDLSAPPHDLSAPPHDLSEPLKPILERISQLNKRERNSEKIKALILELCAIRPMKAVEIAKYFSKGEDYMKRKYLGPLISDRKLTYTYPDMINHPTQAYQTTKGTKMK